MKISAPAGLLAGTALVLVGLIPAAPASAATYLGGFSGSHSLTNYCEDYLVASVGGYASLEYPAQGAYGWRCWDHIGSKWFANEIDLNRACRWAYGAGAYATTSNPSDAYSWRCYV